MVYRVLALIALLIVLLTASLAAETTSPAERPVGEFALGVYWSWEFNAGAAKAAGLEKWEFVKRTCELLHNNGVNTVWLVNIDLADLKSLLKITNPMGLKLLPNLGEIAPQNCRSNMGLDPNASDFHEKALEYYKKTIPAIVKDIGEDRNGVLAWVLCDEPAGPYFELMDPMRKIFAEADPDRPSMAVSQWHLTPKLIAESRLSTFCVDVYPFFAEGNSNGPHTPVASRGYYSVNIQRMVEDAGRDGRTGWIMGQCYNEIWGPSEMKPNGEFVALPGAFVNWQSPTVPEMRWQIWEGLRLGVKGVVFFLLLGLGGGNPSAPPLQPSESTPNILKEQKLVGYPSLLNYKGSPTPQFREMSSVYRSLAKHCDLLRRLAPVTTQWIAADCGGTIGNFTDPKSGKNYAVVVNNDFDHPKTITLTAAMGVKSVRNLLTGKSIPLTPLGWAGGNFGLDITLPAGGGALLEVER